LGTGSTSIWSAIPVARNSPSVSTLPSKSGNRKEPNVSAVAPSERTKDFIVPVDPETTITPRQLELLALYASGYDYAAIGRVKFFSPHTVRYHLGWALRRSGARNLTHLCSVLVEKGMIRRNAEGLYEPVQDLRIAGE
jgi:DNA-binding CsgD family transcriptional regulator